MNRILQSRMSILYRFKGRMGKDSAGEMFLDGDVFGSLRTLALRVVVSYYFMEDKRFCHQVEKNQGKRVVI
jgi:hypothetical protein